MQSLPYAWDRVSPSLYFVQWGAMSLNTNVLPFAESTKSVIRNFIGVHSKRHRQALGNMKGLQKVNYIMSSSCRASQRTHNSYIQNLLSHLTDDSLKLKTHCNAYISQDIKPGFGRSIYLWRPAVSKSTLRVGKQPSDRGSPDLDHYRPSYRT